ncbi:class I SAM-dependent methyltransferase [Sphingobacterium sp. HJSM2_6]|uniref:class I SAM-dependent methyltransferase n=1 Tax=Sphingobacterium sp. HJSM2_6 TaxID=3366264 RepID=UPI003BE855EB
MIEKDKDNFQVITVDAELQQESYSRHTNWYQQQFPNYEDKISVITNFKNYAGSINHWLQLIFFNTLTPFLTDKNKSWLTLGDAYGHDANFLIQQGIQQTTASDLDPNMLQISKEYGLIQHYEVVNAEKMSFSNESFDYILCKESYHHFPRPYAALYEMIRVCKTGIIIIEPQDPIARMPLLLLISNICNKFNIQLIDKIWKNRISYESVGNFVYKVSEREFEKFAAGLNLPMIAVKEINPNFWFVGSNQIQAQMDQPAFKKIYWKKKFRDFLTRLGIFPSQTLVLVAFKQVPNEETLQILKSEGYRISKIKKNPYRNS